MYEKVPDAGKMSDKEKRDIFMHTVIDVVRGIEGFNYSSRQTTGQDVSYSVLKDYLLQEESSTRREAPIADKYVRRGCCGNSDQGRGGMREAGRSDTVSGETRCYSCSRDGHLAQNCPTPGHRMCYVCY